MTAFRAGADLLCSNSKPQCLYLMLDGQSFEEAMLSKVNGIFVKISFEVPDGIHLERGLEYRPAARFNRVGQDALYLSPNEQSARVAIGEYVRSGDPQRFLISYDVEPCVLFDLRHPHAAEVYELARKPWRSALDAGDEPKSWLAADTVRKAGHVGLIDPSRQRPGLWHVTLFRWNEDDAPLVRQIGQPVPIEVKAKT